MKLIQYVIICTLIVCLACVDVFGQQDDSQERNTKKMLVFLVEFPANTEDGSNEGEVKFTDNDIAVVKDRFNRYDGNVNDTVNSVSDYFYDNTDGFLDLEFTFIKVTAPKYRSYYNLNNGQEPGNKHIDLTNYICTQLPDCKDIDGNNVDFSKYCYYWNNEPYLFNHDKPEQSQYYRIYNIFIVYAGNDKNIWPMATFLAFDEDWKNDNFPGFTADNKRYKFFKYAICPVNDGGNPTEIGLYCHEMGHLLGLPDLYGSKSQGEFTLMAYGNGNNGGKTPAGLSFQERDWLSWDYYDKIIPLSGAESNTNGLKCIDITQDGTYTIKPLNTDNQAYRIELNADEYIIAENRQVKSFKWDNYIREGADCGIVFWHVSKKKRNNHHNSLVWGEEFNGPADGGAGLWISDSLFVSKEELTEQKKTEIAEKSFIFRLNNNNIVAKKITNIQFLTDDNGDLTGDISFDYHAQILASDINTSDSVYLGKGTSFINTTENNYNGVVEKDSVKTNQFSLYSLPMAENLTVNTFNDNYCLRYHDALDCAVMDFSLEDNDWGQYLTVNDELSNNQAYIVYPFDSAYGNGSHGVCFFARGQFFKGNKNIEVLNSKDGDGSHWAILPNPYPALLDIAKFLSQNSGKIQGNNIYKMSDGNWEVSPVTDGKIEKMDAFAVSIAKSSDNQFK